MNEIFEQIPKARDIKNNINKETQEIIEHFIKKVTKAINSMNSDSTNISIENKEYQVFNWIHKNKIIDAFNSKWWDIKYVEEQRDWDYVIVSMKKEKIYSQYDR